MRALQIHHKLLGALPWLFMVGAVAGEALSVGAQQKPSAALGTNFLLITVDTLRPDALGWVGGGGDTPHLDALARTGFRLPQTVTPLPLTLPAHTSLLTAQLPRHHGVRDNGQVVPPAAVTLAGHLGGQGYATAAFVSGFPLQKLFGLDVGFDHYDDVMETGREGYVERPAVATTEAALAWLQEAPSPWFLWIHYYDPHDPYEPPRAFWKPGQRGAYEGEVAFTDHAIGLLRAGVKKLLPPEQVLTMVTSDHGEALGEHEEETHGYFLYDSTMVVASVIHQPGKVAAGASSAAVRLIDLAPTALELLGLEPFSEPDGRTLVPLLRGEKLDPAPAFLETLLPWTYFGWAPLKALRHDGWKLVAAPDPELYDLRRDPGETRNRIDEERPTARRLIDQMRQLEAQTTQSTSQSVDDPATLARLRSLGYVGSGASSGKEPPKTGLADPKARVALRRELLAGEDLLKAGRFPQAIQVFEKVLEQEPTNRFATLRSGIARLRVGDLKGAATRLGQAVEQDPERAEARFALADALHRSGRLEEAIPQWMELVRLQPRRSEGWSNLAVALGGAGQGARAAEAQEQVIRLTEATGADFLTLAGYRLGAGDRERARQAARRAVELDPSLADRAKAFSSSDP
ncbi:MAG: sulfatase-like hydrolase/transferase [Deltaproteobacteria bacterium]|nr:sulfatase-like hydrolase/transferase [Deltaproteobacteria bacterium]